MVLLLVGEEEVEVEVEGDVVVVEVAAAVVVRHNPASKAKVIRRPIEEKKRIRPVGLIIIGASSGRRRLRGVVACPVKCEIRHVIHGYNTPNLLIDSFKFTNKKHELNVHFIH